VEFFAEIDLLWCHRVMRGIIVEPTGDSTSHRLINAPGWSLRGNANILNLLMQAVGWLKIGKL
jgi:hypothetical protein